MCHLEILVYHFGRFDLIYGSYYFSCYSLVRSHIKVIIISLKLFSVLTFNKSKDILERINNSYRIPKNKPNTWISYF